MKQVSIKYYMRNRRRLVKALRSLHIQRNITNNQIQKVLKKMTELDDAMMSMEEAEE